MDDELKAIQDDLDNVLERFERYIENNRSHYDLCELDDERLECSPRAEARDTLILYLTYHTELSNLGRARLHAFDKLGEVQVRRSGYVRHYGEQKGNLIAALEAVSNVRFQETRALFDAPKPLSKERDCRFDLVETEYMEVLSDMAARYLNQQDQFPGEYGGNKTLKRSGKRPRYTKEQRESAVKEYIELRKNHGQTAYPLSREACDPIARRHGIESGQTIVNEVRRRLDSKVVAVDETKGLMTLTLRECLSIRD